MCVIGVSKPSQAECSYSSQEEESDSLSLSLTHTHTHITFSHLEHALSSSLVSPATGEADYRLHSGLEQKQLVSYSGSTK
ncbi:hypothetical protein L1987_49361 [Smallanthus sonchifolius]|uniref:Uncharacterized protein n=1 Tax=Smallanthus sonchifolius TaxID=185202 RepID=A0ACB9FUI4_9ASTR|nr:hypothetical protein L1987_49361 [Smallanthus sonchifolius]